MSATDVVSMSNRKSSTKQNNNNHDVTIKDNAFDASK